MRVEVGQIYRSRSRRNDGPCWRVVTAVKYAQGPLDETIITARSVRSDETNTLTEQDWLRVYERAEYYRDRTTHRVWRLERVERVGSELTMIAFALNEPYDVMGIKEDVWNELMEALPDGTQGEENCK